MKLAKREKYFVLAAGICIVGFLILQFGIFPFFESKGRLRKGIKTKEAGLKEISRLRSEFLALQKSSKSMQESLARRKPGFTLFSFLEEAAGKAEVKAHIKYMKPSVSSGTGPHKESIVEMKLAAITLKQLVGYLYRIESPEDLVSIKRISINRNKKETTYLDAVMQVITFQ
jgi:general secretion pathway protein M